MGRDFEKVAAMQDAAAYFCFHAVLFSSPPPISSWFGGSETHGRGGEGVSLHIRRPRHLLKFWISFARNSCRQANEPSITGTCVLVCEEKGSNSGFRPVYNLT